MWTEAWRCSEGVLKKNSCLECLWCKESDCMTSCSLTDRPAASCLSSQPSQVFAARTAGCVNVTSAATCLDPDQPQVFIKHIFIHTTSELFSYFYWIFVWSLISVTSRNQMELNSSSSSVNEVNSIFPLYVSANHRYVSSCPYVSWCLWAHVHIEVFCLSWKIWIHLINSWKMSWRLVTNF